MNREEVSVFVSFSSRDREVVERDIEWLKDEGIHVWCFHRGIEVAQQNYGKAIVQSIKQSGLVLFYLSYSSNQSEACADEVKIAREEGKRIIRIDLDSVNISDSIRYYLPHAHQAIVRDHDFQGYKLKLLRAVTDNHTEQLAKSGFFKSRRLSIVSLVLAALGMFVLPAGFGAVGVGIRALMRRRSNPLTRGWVWLTALAIAIGCVEVLEIVVAMLDGFRQASSG